MMTKPGKHLRKKPPGFTSAFLSLLDAPHLKQTDCVVSASLNELLSPGKDGSIVSLLSHVTSVFFFEISSLSLSP